MQSDGEHGRRQDGEAPGHLGHHEHDGQRRPQNFPEEHIIPTMTKGAGLWPREGTWARTAATPKRRGRRR